MATTTSKAIETTHAPIIHAWASQGIFGSVERRLGKRS